jgi:Cysteine-rich secretory protein family
MKNLFKLGMIVSVIASGLLLESLEGWSKPQQIQSRLPQLPQPQKAVQIDSGWAEATGEASLPAAQDIIDILNLVRQNPKIVAPVLLQMQQSFKGSSKMLNFPGMNVNIGKGKKLSFSKANYITFEGVFAVNNAAQAIVKQSPVPPVQLSAGLSNAALGHSQYAASIQKIVHVIGDNTPSKRIAQYGERKGEFGENMLMDFSNVRTANLIVRWIIDDGITQRIHRKNVFNEQFRYAGAGCAFSKNNNIYCTLVFAHSFTENAKANTFNLK